MSSVILTILCGLSGWFFRTNLPLATYFMLIAVGIDIRLQAERVIKKIQAGTDQ